MPSGISASVRPETPETVMLDNLVPDKLSILLVRLMAEKAAEVWREVLEDKLFIWLVKFVSILLSSDLISEIFESKSFWESPDGADWPETIFSIIPIVFSRALWSADGWLAIAPLFFIFPSSL